MMGRLQEGIVHCRKALKLKPGYLLALYNLAQAHMHLDAPLRARHYVAKALAIAPHDPSIRELASGWA